MSEESEQQTNTDFAKTDTTDNSSERSGILQINEGIKSGESKFKVFTFAPSSSDGHDTQKCIDFWEFIEGRDDLMPAKGFRLIPMETTSTPNTTDDAGEESTDWNAIFDMMKEHGLDKYSSMSTDKCNICEYEKSIECVCEDHFDPAELNDWDPFRKTYTDAAVLTDDIKTADAVTQTDFKDPKELELEYRSKLMDEIDELFKRVSVTCDCSMGETCKEQIASPEGIPSEYSIKTLNKETCCCGKDSCYCTEYFKVLSAISAANKEADDLDITDVETCTCSSLCLSWIRNYKSLLQCKIELQSLYGEKVNRKVVCVCGQGKCPCSIVVKLHKEIDRIFGWGRDDTTELVYCTCKNYYGGVTRNLSISSITSHKTCKCTYCDSLFVAVENADLCNNCIYKGIRTSEYCSLDAEIVKSPVCGCNNNSNIGLKASSSFVAKKVSKKNTKVEAIGSKPALTRNELDTKNSPKTNSSSRSQSKRPAGSRKNTALLEPRSRVQFGSASNEKPSRLSDKSNRRRVSVVQGSYTIAKDRWKNLKKIEEAQKLTEETASAPSLQSSSNCSVVPLGTCGKNAVNVKKCSCGAFLAGCICANNTPTGSKEDLDNSKNEQIAGMDDWCYVSRGVDYDIIELKTNRMETSNAECFTESKEQEITNASEVKYMQTANYNKDSTSGDSVRSKDGGASVTWYKIIDTFKECQSNDEFAFSNNSAIDHRYSLNTHGFSIRNHQFPSKDYKNFDGSTIHEDSSVVTGNKSDDIYTNDGKLIENVFSAENKNFKSADGRRESFRVSDGHMVDRFRGNSLNEPWCFSNSPSESGKDSWEKVKANSEHSPALDSPRNQNTKTHYYLCNVPHNNHTYRLNSGVSKHEENDTSNNSTISGRTCNCHHACNVRASQCEAISSEDDVNEGTDHYGAYNYDEDGCSKDGRNSTRKYGCRDYTDDQYKFTKCVNERVTTPNKSGSHSEDTYVEYAKNLFDSNPSTDRDTDDDVENYTGRYFKRKEISNKSNCVCACGAIRNYNTEQFNETYNNPEQFQTTYNNPEEFEENYNTETANTTNKHTAGTVPLTVNLARDKTNASKCNSAMNNHRGRSIGEDFDKIKSQSSDSLPRVNEINKYSTHICSSARHVIQPNGKCEILPGERDLYGDDSVEVRLSYCENHSNSGWDLPADGKCGGGDDEIVASEDHFGFEKCIHRGADKCTERGRGRVEYDQFSTPREAIKMSNSVKPVKKPRMKYTESNCTNKKECLKHTRNSDTYNAFKLAPKPNPQCTNRVQNASTIGMKKRPGFDDKPMQTKKWTNEITKSNSINQGNYFTGGSTARGINTSKKDYSVPTMNNCKSWNYNRWETRDSVVSASSVAGEVSNVHGKLPVIGEAGKKIKCIKRINGSKVSDSSGVKVTPQRRN